MKLSRRPDRKVIMQDSLEKQEHDLENNNSNNFGEWISAFNIDKDDWFKFPPDEEQLIDIIPFEVTTKNHPDFKKLKVYKDGKGNEYREDYYMDYYVHRRLGPGGRADVLCLEKNFGKECPACEERKKLLEEKTYEWDDEELIPLKWKKRTIMSIKDLKDNGKRKAFDYPEAHFKRNLLKKTKRVRGEDSQICLSDISDEGYSISFFAEASDMKDKKTGKPITFKDGTAVPGEIKDIDFVKRTEGYPDSIIEESFKLDTLMNILSYEEIEAIMLGEEPEATNEETTKVSEPKKEESGLSEREKRLQEREEKLKAKGTYENENVCPNGLTFGVDNLSDDVCDNCPKDPECAAEFERLQN